MINKIIFLLSSTLLLISSTAFSQEKSPTSFESRFSAKLEFGTLGVTSNSPYLALDTDGTAYFPDSFEKIDDYDDDSYRSLISPFFLFDLNYMVTHDFMVYLGTPFFNDSRRGLTTGFEKLFKD